LDEQAFRQALGGFPTGVAVVTAIDREGEPVGLTGSSFNSVSLAPPLVLFSVARAARHGECLIAAEAFAINVLCEHQRELSTAFARAAADRWERAQSRPGATGSPVFPQALAVFECRAVARHDGGDHVIVVGEVVHFEIHRDERPLVFYRSRYRALDGYEGQVGAPPDVFLDWGW
jgi:flavin reductase (DIM6/NTAB) family NADH-FMN oxidoreductase RutF